MKNKKYSIYPCKGYKYIWFEKISNNQPIQRRLILESSYVFPRELQFSNFITGGGGVVEQEEDNKLVL